MNERHFALGMTAVLFAAGVAIGLLLGLPVELALFVAVVGTGIVLAGAVR